MIQRSQVNEDPELLPFFDGSHSYRWIGEKRHIIVSRLSVYIYSWQPF